MEKEIKENIIKKGIDAYLYDMEIDFSNDKMLQDLYDIESNEIGHVLIFNKKENEFIFQSKDLVDYGVSSVNNAIIQCLANIKYLKDIFNRKNIFKRNYDINIEREVTKNFYKIIQYMWHYNEFEIINEYIEFIFQLSELSGIKDINYNIESLIKFYLVAIHSELSVEENNKINYKLYELENEFCNDDDSLIKKIFFFKQKSVNKCHCNKNITKKNCLLFFNVKDFLRNNPKMTKFCPNSIFCFEHEFFCKKCKITINSKIEFINYPEILIIIFQYMPKQKLELNEELKIKKKENYKLISIIFENEIFQTNEIKILKTYCKSPVNNKWYEYGGTSYDKDNKDKNKKDINFNNIKSINLIPKLLIFQKESK